MIVTTISQLLQPFHLLIAFVEHDHQLKSRHCMHLMLNRCAGHETDSETKPSYLHLCLHGSEGFQSRGLTVSSYTLKAFSNLILILYSPLTLNDVKALSYSFQNVLCRCQEVYLPTQQAITTYHKNTSQCIFTL